jgi:hypothetical protein
MPKFRKGEPRPPNAGRRIGSKNKIPLAAKEAIVQALNADGGAVAYLRRMKNSKVGSDRAAFMHLVGKLVPREIDIDLPDERQVPVIVTMPYNGRGPLPGETAEAFRARVERAKNGH